MQGEEMRKGNEDAQIGIEKHPLCIWRSSLKQSGRSWPGLSHSNGLGMLSQPDAEEICWRICALEFSVYISLGLSSGKRRGGRWRMSRWRGQG